MEKKLKITKATVKRINDHSKVWSENYIHSIYTIGEILNHIGIILGESGHYEINDGLYDDVQPLISSDGKRQFISGAVRGDYTKRIIRGLSTKYPSWISVTFTHGLNGVDIYDVNSLVRAIANENNPV